MLRSTANKTNSNIKNNTNINTIIIWVSIFFIGLCIRLFYYTALNQILIYPDSSEYLSTADRIVNLRLHSSRVPMYPLFILIAKNILFFLDTATAVVVMQSVVSSAASVFLFIGACKIFRSKVKGFLFLIFWSISICIINWDFMVLTESMTINLMIFLIFCFIMYMEKKKESYHMMLYIICLILIFTKPFFILLPPIIAAIILLKGKLSGNWKKAAAVALASVAVIYFSVFAYSYANYRQNGYFGISNVSIINKFGKILQYGMYEFDDNSRITIGIKKYIKDSGGELPVPVQFIADNKLAYNNYSEISSYVNRIIKDHPVVFMKETCKVVIRDLSKESVFTDYNNVYSNHNYYKKWPIQLFNITNSIGFISTFRFLFIILFIEFIAEVYLIIRGRRIEWFWILAFIFVAFQFGMSVIGSHGEYQRLMVPSYIFIFLLFFKYIYVIAGLLPKLFNFAGMPFQKKV